MDNGTIEPIISDDGQWWWDEAQWQPIATLPPPAVTPAPAPAPAPAAVGRPSWLAADAELPALAGQVPGGSAAKGRGQGVRMPRPSGRLLAITALVVVLGAGAIFVVGPAIASHTTPVSGPTLAGDRCGLSSAGDTYLCFPGKISLTGAQSISSAFLGVHEVRKETTCAEYAAHGFIQAFDLPGNYAYDHRNYDQPGIHLFDMSGTLSPYAGPGDFTPASQQSADFRILYAEHSYRAPAQGSHAWTLSIGASGAGKLALNKLPGDDGNISGTITWTCLESKGKP